ncbi:ATP-dependent zinc protease [Hymenobacter sp. BRD128]|uniref:ATP-dependent zinc protease family protein n=1 Tax=Hymenobacter sp. BRD128 TaxID=2675878 RepID=UPI001562F777|nr:RimK/LysX family protein [Hymenobacter sp. BRD128]QKG55440.1 ATP-dependent zinc protease [Hymenobacter sp. BRD128]
MKKRPDKRLLGRRELIDLPALGLLGVVAKVDTGAYTSAIHCADLHLETDPATGRPVLHVRLLDPEHPATDGQPLAFHEFAERNIRSSNGEVQARYVIRTVVQLYGEDFSTEFSLADRSDLKHPVLLGRSLLRQGRFVVDVARRDMAYQAERRAAAKNALPSAAPGGPV